ncbi:hypothetical protein [Streptococcus pantholopis]|nr:hypothetical protein [Streptococcus pantholopis]
MAKRKKLSRPAKVFWGLLAVVLISITGIWGYNRYMEKKKVDQLYQHGFQLLEEQIATYIKENYSGISKIEFSPIYIDGDGKFTMRTAYVIPIIYDNYGNKAKLGGRVENTNRVYAKHGLLNGISSLDFDINGNWIIYLDNSANGNQIDVSKYDHLPAKAKLSTNDFIDDNITSLVQANHLKGVFASKDGSSNTLIRYNTEIRWGK